MRNHQPPAGCMELLQGVCNVPTPARCLVSPGAIGDNLLNFEQVPFVCRRVIRCPWGAIGSNQRKIALAAIYRRRAAADPGPLGRWYARRAAASCQKVNVFENVPAEFEKSFAFLPRFCK